MENSRGNGEIPDNANENCPGSQSESAGKLNSCQGCPNQQICATTPKDPNPAELVEIAERMATVKHKILVLSGKGGVGKSTFSAQLSYALAEMDHEVGLLDIDICGPSIPKMLGLEGQQIHRSNLGWSPVYVDSNLGVMSIGFMLGNPTETTSGQYEDVSGWALACLEEKVPELLNLMTSTDVFDSSGGGATKMCQDMGIPFLGRVPLDPQLCRASDQGRSCFADQKCAASAPALKAIIHNLFPRPPENAIPS